MWFQNRRAKWRKKENTKKGPGRPAHNAHPQTCSGDPIDPEELKKREQERQERKRRKQEERMRRMEERKRQAALTGRTDVRSLSGADSSDNLSRDGMDSSREAISDNEIDVVGENLSDAEDELGGGKDKVSGTPSEVGRPLQPHKPALKSPFSIESLLEAPKVPRGRRPNSKYPRVQASKSMNPLSLGMYPLFPITQPVGFQVERPPTPPTPSPPTSPEPGCTFSSPSALRAGPAGREGGGAGAARLSSSCPSSSRRTPSPTDTPPLECPSSSSPGTDSSSSPATTASSSAGAFVGSSSFSSPSGSASFAGVGGGSALHGGRHHHHHNHHHRPQNLHLHVHAARSCPSPVSSYPTSYPTTSPTPTSRPLPATPPPQLHRTTNSHSSNGLTDDDHPNRTLEEEDPTVVPGSRHSPALPSVPPTTTSTTASTTALPSPPPASPSSRDLDQ